MQFTKQIRVQKPGINDLDNDRENERLTVNSRNSSGTTTIT